LFTTASLCCGLASNIYELVALRVIQSVGGGAFMPAATGIVTDLWGKDRDKALGLFSSIFPIGGIVGPVLGGVFVGYWSWRGIFLINVPIGVVLLVVGFVLIPSRPPSRNQGPFDLVGITLLGVSLLAGMLGVTYLGNPTHHGDDPLFIGPMVICIAAGYLFVRHTRRAASPFISPRLLYGPVFGAMNVINVVFGAAAAGFGALVAVYAQDRLHISALSSSTMLVARSVGMVVAAGIAVRLLRRFGVRLPMTLGYLVIVVGLLLTLLNGPVLNPYTWVAVGATVTGIGIGISAPSSNNAALQLAPHNAAAIAGLRGMFRQVGGITAVSIVTSVAARSGDPARALGIAFIVFAAIVLAVLPLIQQVPDHRGSW
jgi:MFS family permease